MNNTEMLIRAMTSGGGGGGDCVVFVSYADTFSTVVEAAKTRKTIVFSDEITIETSEGNATLYMEIIGNYIYSTAPSFGEQFFFSTIYDNPTLDKPMSITVAIDSDSGWSTMVKFIDTAN